MAKKQNRAPYLSQPETTWGWVYFALQLIVLPIALNKLNIYLKLSSSWLNLAYYTVNFVAVILIFRSYLVRSLSHAGSHFFQLLKGCILGLSVYWACNYGMGWLAGKLLPGFSNVNDSNVLAMMQENFWPWAIATVVMVPLTEELFYRGLIFRGLRPRKRKLAYILSTLAFCAVHVIGYIGSYPWHTLLLCFVQYIPAGLCLAWACDEADNIYASVLVHSVINAMGVFSGR